MYGLKAVPFERLDVSAACEAVKGNASGARLNPCPSFIHTTRKLVAPSGRTDQEKQPDFVRPSSLERNQQATSSKSKLIR
jgi:hypothetical protein